MPSECWKPADATSWISSPSRIHDTPRPTTTIQWNLVHGRRSSRAGIRLRTASGGAGWVAAVIVGPPVAGCRRASRGASVLRQVASDAGADLAAEVHDLARPDRGGVLGTAHGRGRRRRRRRPGWSFASARARTRFSARSRPGTITDRLL